MSVPAFVDSLKAHVSELAAALQAPASLEAIQSAQQWFGQELPAEIQQAYQVANGQRPSLPGVLFGLQWLSLEAAEQEYRVWQGITAEDSNLESRPAGTIQPVNFSPAWFPFAVDGGGNGLAVDLAPASLGTVGQVITYGPDEQTRLVVAPSLDAFFSWATSEIETGHLTVEGQYVQLSGASSLLDELHRRV